MKITLCGSARFEKEFKRWNKELTLRCHLVYSLSVYPSDEGYRKDWYTEEQKEVLDKMHLRKIDESDAIIVLDVEGYIGVSTAREIGYAMGTGKKIFYLSKTAEEEFLK